MQSAKCKIIYEDNNLLVLDKPAGLIVDDIPRRVHRLDKDTSGILLVAKNNKVLEFLQKQFKERKVEKKYLALVVGNLKDPQGLIETLLGREPKKRKKQRVYLFFGPEAAKKNLRKAITKYSVLKNYTDGKNYYTLIEVKPITGRKHQIRAHLAHIGFPVAGDKMYGFKRQPCPEGLTRQFLHASYLKVKLPDGKIKEFYSHLPADLNKVIKKLKILNFKL